MDREEVARPYFKLQPDYSLRGFWLRKNQAVHHIDGDPSNNDLKNLRIVKLNRKQS